MAQAAAARIIANDPKLPSGILPPGTAGRILEVGLILFARNGFHGTSIRDIGKEIGLKPANLYDHFPSKEHLLAELVRIGHEELLRAMSKALIDAGGGPVQQMKALVTAHVRLHAEYAMLAVVANNEMHALSPALVAPALALRQQAEALLFGVIERGVQAGVFDPPDPWLTGAAIGGMGMRVANWYRSTRDLPIDHLTEVYAELALRMLGVRASARRR